MAVKTKSFLDGSLPDELINLVLSLGTNWGDVMDKSNLMVNHLSGAMTNEIYRISWPTKTGNSSVLVRVYGEGVELFFDRVDEIRTFEYLSMEGYGPKLLGHFSEGRVEEFINARTLSVCDLRDPIISGLIAEKLKEFHNLDMPGSKKVILWDRMRKWLIEAKKLCTSHHVREFHLDSLDKEINRLEKFEYAVNHQQKIGFCHNDLQYGNIMIDDSTRSVTIIDYEYASYNPVAYDLANHFCEMAANYHTDKPHILDYNKYPGQEERQQFVRRYLSDTATDYEVEKLVDDIERYTLANHIFWGLWGIISAYVNHIEFDYLEYARQRFEQYWLKKKTMSDLYTL